MKIEINKGCIPYLILLFLLLKILMHLRLLFAKSSGSGGIRTHASEETGALNQRLRPLGHATLATVNSTVPGQ